jgi:hypothetical protein
MRLNALNYVRTKYQNLWMRFSSILECRAISLRTGFYLTAILVFYLNLLLNINFKFTKAI